MIHILLIFIAVATLAGLLADRAGRPGGFDFDAAPVARLG